MQSAFNDLIDNFDLLSLEEKEYAIKVFKKNIIETKREKLVKRVRESRKNFQSGKIKMGGLKELYQDLEND